MSKLKDLLREKVTFAFLHRDRVQKLDDLAGQAHVWLYITDAREFHIAIWRGKVFPSQSEWDTFLRHLPREVLPRGPLPTFEQVNQPGRKVLKAHWHIQVPQPFGEPHDDQATTTTPNQRPTAQPPACD